MKKYKCLMKGLMLLWAAVALAACENIGTPSSSGRPYEVLVVVDDEMWERPAGRALFSVLDTDIPGLPQPERSFQISQSDPRHYSRAMKLFRNIIQVEIDPNEYTQTKIKYSRDVFAQPQVIRITEREGRQILGFDLDDGDVGLGIRTEHFAREFTIVGETHFDFVSAVNNVVVGKNQTVGADDEARTRAAAFRFLTGTAAKGEGKAKAAEDFRVAFVKAKRVGAFNDAGFAHGGNVHDALAVLFNELNEVGQLSRGDGCLRSQAAGNGGRRGQESAGKSNGGSGNHCGRLERFGEHFLLLLRYRMSGARINPRAMRRALSALVC